MPSVEAYKLYVTELMDKGALSRKEIGEIKRAFDDRADDLETVVQNAVKVISDLTDYTSVGVSAHSGKEKIVKLDIFRCRPDQALLLIVTENTFIRDKFMEIPSGMTDEQVKDAGMLISKYFTGRELGEISSVGDALKEEFAGYRDIFDSVMNAIEEYVEKDKAEVVLEGEGKILNHPEYNNDSEKVKNFLSVITSKDRLADLLAEDNDDIEINIKIGGEDADMPEDCSLVTATYSAGGVNIGTYGVIGPLRMDYQKVVSVLEGVGTILEDMINKK